MKAQDMRAGDQFFHQGKLNATIMEVLPKHPRANQSGRADRYMHFLVRYHDEDYQMIRSWLPDDDTNYIRPDAKG